jgi:hypothetical protein
MADEYNSAVDEETPPKKTSRFYDEEGTYVGGERTQEMRAAKTQASEDEEEPEEYESYEEEAPEEPEEEEVEEAPKKDRASLKSILSKATHTAGRSLKTGAGLVASGAKFAAKESIKGAKYIRSEVEAARENMEAEEEAEEAEEEEEYTSILKKNTTKAKVAKAKVAKAKSGKKLPSPSKGLKAPKGIVKGKKAKGVKGGRLASALKSASEFSEATLRESKKGQIKGTPFKTKAKNAGKTKAELIAEKVGEILEDYNEDGDINEIDIAIHNKLIEDGYDEGNIIPFNGGTKAEMPLGKKQYEGRGKVSPREKPQLTTKRLDTATIDSMVFSGSKGSMIPESKGVKELIPLRPRNPNSALTKGKNEIPIKAKVPDVPFSQKPKDITGMLGSGKTNTPIPVNAKKDVSMISQVRRESTGFPNIKGRNITGNGFPFNSRFTGNIPSRSPISGELPFRGRTGNNIPVKLNIAGEDSPITGRMSPTMPLKK